MMMPRGKQAGWWLGGLSAALAVLYILPPAEYRFYPRCPFFALTHWLCPGCGGTRAVYELLHLNLRGALHYNALVTVLLPLVLIWFGWGSYQAFRHGRFPSVPWPRTIAVCLGAVSLVFAVVRDSGLAFTI